MSKRKYTPGPWTWSGSWPEPYSLDGAGGQQVLRALNGAVYSEYSSDSATLELRSEEDAALIAAAPDLLETLQMIRDCQPAFDALTPANAELLCAAIAKAKGE